MDKNIYIDVIHNRIDLLKKQIDFLSNLDDISAYDKGRLQALEEELINRRTEERIRTLNE